MKHKKPTAHTLRLRRIRAIKEEEKLVEERAKRIAAEALTEYGQIWLIDRDRHPVMVVPCLSSLQSKIFIHLKSGRIALTSPYHYPKDAPLELWGHAKALDWKKILGLENGETTANPVL